MKIPLPGTLDVGSLKAHDSFVSNGFSLRTLNTTFYRTTSDNSISLLFVNKSSDWNFEEFSGM